MLAVRSPNTQDNPSSSNPRPQLTGRYRIVCPSRKYSAEQSDDPQIIASSPAHCCLVIRPSDPQEGHAKTAQKGFSALPSSPACSSRKIVPGCICSGIHTSRRFNSATMLASSSQRLSSFVTHVSSPTLTSGCGRDLQKQLALSIECTTSGAEHNSFFVPVNPTFHKKRMPD
jgi:hypothetical protein